MDVDRWLGWCDLWPEVLRGIVPVFSLLDDGDLGRCVGRDYAVHVAVLRGTLSRRSLVVCFKTALERLAGYRKTGIVPPEPRSELPATVEGTATSLG